MDIGDLRREYESKPFKRKDLDDSPFEQFDKWFSVAREAGVEEVNACSLGTANKDGVIGLRTVLLKYYDERGFVFFTNYTSAKACDIDENPNVTMLFPWLQLYRQIIIRGKAEKISKAESLKYFLSRPRGSQLGAWVSDQSSVVSTRGFLEKKFKEMKEKFLNKEIPLPDHWGGYRLSPDFFEFWQGRTNRLHDRFAYYPEEINWRIERLAP